MADAEHIEFDEPPRLGVAPLLLDDADSRLQCEASLVSAIIADTTGATLARCTFPAEVLSVPQLRALYAALKGGVAPDDVLELSRVSKIMLPTIFEIAERDRQGLWFDHNLAAIQAEYRREQLKRLTLEIERGSDPAAILARFKMLEEPAAARLIAKGLGLFAVPVDGDSECLLGDRYINRGDGAILSGSSGMGKSSLQILLAVLWALARDAFGIKPNGPLVSLIIQAEDSDGDIAEVFASISHKLNLTEEEKKIVTERVLVVTDRVNRGAMFFVEARRLVALHKPDILWINPLQAFLDGDITSAKDLGGFLREGLNSIDPRCAKFIVHHTTKPATGKDKGERLWHEVMYDMAGGAELINWARAIMSLRASEVEGQFKLVLAKRGRRAGVTVEVDQGAGARHEPVTEIEIRHSAESIEVPGRAAKMRVIFWEQMPLAVSADGQVIRGAKKTDTRYKFSDIHPFMGQFSREKPGSVANILRMATATMTISRPALNNMLIQAVEDGVLAKDGRGFWPAT